MAKRPAQEPLEETENSASPSIKKLRLDSTIHSPSGSEATTNAQNNYTADKLNAYSYADVKDRMIDSSDDELDAFEASEDETVPGQRRQIAPTEGYDDLYLDTIDRSILDFDFEKLCSVTLSNINVYACLVCGKYFQGRGSKSHAYYHALDIGHHVHINMQTKKVYVLPEGYEVKSKSLDDIKFVVDPHLSKEEVLRLDQETKEPLELAGKPYRPGFVGMNNIKANDYFNVIIQSLVHIPPLRNYFMLEDFAQKSELVRRFSVLVRKIWNTRAFKSHVSPHELIQQVSRQSNKRFDLTAQSDPVDFLSWFLNNMHSAIGGSKTKPGTSIIHKVLQGKLKVESQEIAAKADAKDRLRFEDAAGVTSSVSHFLILTLDLPAAPLFQDELEKNVIPQIPLTSLLSKYDGIRIAEQSNARKRYRLLHPLPPYLFFHIKRFSANKFIAERNPTIVTFPSRSLNMAPYVEPNPSIHAPGEPIWYDLVANVTHEAVRIRDDSVEGEAEKKVWRTQLRDRARDEWLEIQDLYVEKVPSETLFTKESYLMVWERRREKKKK